MNVSLLRDKADLVSAILKALANEKCLEIMCALLEGEKAVGELEKIVGLSQSALSQHLARLRRDGIVKTRREAQTIYYSHHNSLVEKILYSLSVILNED